MTWPGLPKARTADRLRSGDGGPGELAIAAGWRMAVSAGLLALALLPGRAGADTLVLPSGQDAEFHDAYWEEDSGTLRLRYVVPAVGDDAYARDHDAVFADMESLCAGPGLAMIEDDGNAWDGVTVTMMAMAVEFGHTAPDVVQFFEAFLVQDGNCIWDEF